MHFFLRLSTRMMRMRKTTIALIIFLFVTCSATIAFILEPTTFHNWFNALYWVMTTMATVGYGDFFATTVSGKLFTLFLYIFGIGLLSLVIGKVIDSIGGIQRQREAGTLTYHGRNHVITIAEKDGERAYTIAVSNKDKDMADYLKSLEPPELHDAENRKYELRKYKLNDELIRFLSGDHLRLELSDNEYGIAYIDFFTLTDTIEMKYGRQKLLRLSADIDNYSDLQLVWNPKKGLIGCYDVEHEAYADLCSFTQFIEQPEAYLIQFLEGEL